MHSIWSTANLTLQPISYFLLDLLLSLFVNRNGVDVRQCCSCKRCRFETLSVSVSKDFFFCQHFLDNSVAHEDDSALPPQSWWSLTRLARHCPTWAAWVEQSKRWMIQDSRGKSDLTWTWSISCFILKGCCSINLFPVFELKILLSG